MVFEEAQISAWIASLWLPFLRVTGAMMAAPLFGSSYVPIRSRIAVALFTALAVAPVIPQAPAVSALSLEAVVIAANEIVIGICIGFLVQLVFEAIVFAGQTISMGMGLGFAMMVDPQRGNSVPILSQFFLLITLLIFLALDGHLAFLELVAGSFAIWPVGVAMVSVDTLGLVIEWSGEIFGGAIRVALPAVIALLVVQIGVGVISRAAPTLNLFAVGFPIAILVGYLVLYQMMPLFIPALDSLLAPAFETTRVLLEGGSNG
ncbi:flagellar biosynthetic protein FliR [Litorivivens lipolytica]|uniref:Flagellar biosynthetic protein FliR n=1 Tax=Litorivivens lipolytica TaxID=1524264 RepID=A0A7W4Z5X6_9GAMM|nr:flagellar biosynthetic protein FliR [Litorivivens lipolytica]MBB3046355.1 flagellar biosynthetic protein FliR [Litorivivens lipolytica]